MSLQERLLPVIRRVTVPRDGLLLDTLLTRPLGDWLHVLLVEDLPDRTRFVQPADLQRAGLTLEQAWSTAHDNLGVSAHEDVQPIDGGVRVRGHGGYASSLYLLEPWRHAIADRVHGELLAFAPDVDELVVVGSEHPSLERIAQWAFQTFRETSRPLSPAPLTAEERFRPNQRLLAAFTYAEQDELLLQTAPDGTYVGELALHLGPDGSASTHTRIEPGYTCWLPMADVVDTPNGPVDFDSLGMPRVAGLHPPRFRWGGPTSVTR